MAQQTSSKSYQNNPFYIALEGLTTFFKKAQSVAILMIVLSALAFFGNGISSVRDAVSGDRSNTQVQLQDKDVQRQVQDTYNALPLAGWVILGVIVATILFIVILVGVVISGISDYTAARLALGHETNLGEAFKEVFAHIGSYLWLQIIVGVKIFLWSLLLIVPGLIMAVRYSLAGTSFFAKGTRGNKAVKHSLELTKGAWLTTFAANGLWNMITFGAIDPLLRPGTNAVLYRQFSTTKEKPAAHWLSWLTLLLPIVLAVLFILFVLLVVVVLASTSHSFSL